MSALFRVRVLAVCDRRLWCAVAGQLTAGTSSALRTELTERCAGATVVALDLRQLTCTAGELVPSGPWPDGPRTVHVLAAEPLRSCTPEDGRLHWHADLAVAWHAWNSLSP
ncbi:hypothetical protein [Streptomyces sp. NPDC093970]|uniref:hypothetical protein n=1 Tax=Streptomyces sp. NPDC093970 TaxID=3155076 RepID=UPI0034227D86